MIAATCCLTKEFNSLDPSRSWVDSLAPGTSNLVRVEALSNHELVVHDLFVDLVVPPIAYRYEVLDLDELADALTSGAINNSGDQAQITVTVAAS